MAHFARANLIVSHATQKEKLISFFQFVCKVCVGVNWHACECVHYFILFSFSVGAGQ